MMDGSGFRRSGQRRRREEEEEEASKQRDTADGGNSNERIQPSLGMDQATRLAAAASAFGMVGLPPPAPRGGGLVGGGLSAAAGLAQGLGFAANLGLQQSLPALQLDFAAAETLRQRLILEERARLVAQAALLHNNPIGAGLPGSTAANLLSAILRDAVRGPSAQLPNQVAQQPEPPPPPKKRKLAESTTGFEIPLSETDKKATFPLPPARGNAQTLSVGALSSFKEKWEAIGSHSRPTTAAVQREVFSRVLFKPNFDPMRSKIRGQPEGAGAKRHSGTGNTKAGRKWG